MKSVLLIAGFILVAYINSIRCFQSSDCNYKVAYATATQLKYDWQCPDDGTNVCLKVYRCEAFDKANFKQLIVDENGCSINKTLISDITYPTDLTATATSDYNWITNVRQRIFFQCQLHFTTKSGPCPRPTC